MKVVAAIVLFLVLSALFHDLGVEGKKKKKSKKDKKKGKKSKKEEKRKEDNYDPYDPYDDPYGGYGDENGSALEGNPDWYKEPATRSMKAWQLHGQAMEKAKADEFEAALPAFRAAVRLNPRSAQLWNDLGVTEMRIKDFARAKHRFLKALELDPKYEMAIENDEDVKKELGDAYNDDLGEFPQEHKISEVPEMSPEELWNLTVNDDVENSRLLGDSPIVVRGAAEAWGWDIEKINFPYLKKIHGHKNADYYPHNMKEETVKPLFSQLDKALEELEWSLPPENNDQPKEFDYSTSGTYIQWNVDENSWRDLMIKMNATLPEVYEDSHWTTKCFDSGGVTKFNQNLHWKMMLIGEKGAGMFNHKDVMRMASWQVQLQGRKLWHVCGPDQESKMYHAGDVNWFKPNYNNWPKAKKAKCYQTITEPGDSMYYPRDWWHQTTNLDATNIAFSGSMINNDCVREFGKEMSMQCSNSDEKRHTVFQPEKNFCDQVAQCQTVWTNTYGDVDPIMERRRLAKEEKAKARKEKKKAKREKKKAAKAAKKAKAAAEQGNDEEGGEGYDFGSMGSEDEL